MHNVSRKKVSRAIEDKHRTQYEKQQQQQTSIHTNDSDSICWVKGITQQNRIVNRLSIPAENSRDLCFYLFFLCPIRN